MYKVTLEHTNEYGTSTETIKTFSNKEAAEKMIKELPAFGSNIKASVK